MKEALDILAFSDVYKLDDSEVATSLNIVSDMVDLPPSEVFNPNSKFIDISCTSGRFPVEIKNRLMHSNSMREKFPDEAEREKYILDNQIYAICSNQVSAFITRKMLYGNCMIEGNVRFIEKYESKVLKKNANYNELIEKEFGSMKFDVVIGNPPYNRGADLDFVYMGFQIATKYVVMITPAKWQTAADMNIASNNLNYTDFRKTIVPYMEYVMFIPDSFDVFDIQLKDGISYFSINKTKNENEDCIVENSSKLQKIINSKEVRPIYTGDTLWNCGNSIIKHMGKYKSFQFKGRSGRYWVCTGKNMSHGGGHLASGGGNIKGIGTGGYFFTNNGNLNCVSKSDILDSKISLTSFQKYTAVTYKSDSVEECKSFVSWLNTKFTRFFVMVGLCKRDILFNNYGFRFVPAPPALQTNPDANPWDHIYTDEELYDYFNIPQKYREIIEAVIKERK